MYLSSFVAGMFSGAPPGKQPLSCAVAAVG